MDLKEAMATNVRRERHARKMTQEELADRAGLSARYLGSIERAAVSASVRQSTASVGQFAVIHAPSVGVEMIPINLGDDADIEH
jgi:predicted transcriptional regulator